MQMEIEREYVVIMNPDRLSLCVEHILNSRGFHKVIMHGTRKKRPNEQKQGIKRSENRTTMKQRNKNERVVDLEYILKC